MKEFKTKTAALIFGLLALAAPRAHAAYEEIEQTFTVPLGSATAYTTVTLNRVNIHDIILDVPLLDSGDTATCTLQVAMDGLLYVPTGISTKTIGATADGALVIFNSSQLNVIADGPVKFYMQCSSAQIADRRFKVRFLVEE